LIPFSINQINLNWRSPPFCSRQQKQQDGSGSLNLRITMILSQNDICTQIKNDFHCQFRNSFQFLPQRVWTSRQLLSINADHDTNLKKVEPIPKFETPMFHPPPGSYQKEIHVTR
jgi:hypothetical protein